MPYIAHRINQYISRGSTLCQTFFALTWYNQIDGCKNRRFVLGSIRNIWNKRGVLGMISIVLLWICVGSREAVVSSFFSWNLNPWCRIGGGKELLLTRGILLGLGVGLVGCQGWWSELFGSDWKGSWWLLVLDSFLGCVRTDEDFLVPIFQFFALTSLCFPPLAFVELVVGAARSPFQSSELFLLVGLP